MKRQARRNVTSVTVIYKCLAVESRDVGITYKWDKSGTLYNQFHYFAKPKCTKNHVKKVPDFIWGQSDIMRVKFYTRKWLEDQTTSLVFNNRGFQLSDATI